jgi:hypothetical protein
VLLASVVAAAEQSITLRVSATIPPRPCEYPQPCAPVPQSTVTRVTVDDQQVRYVGSTPAVTQKGDVLTVTF